MRHISITIAAASTLAIALGTATGVADNNQYWDNTSSWPVKQKEDTVMINGNQYALDAIPTALEQKIADSTGNTGIAVYENGSTQADFGPAGWYDGGIESVGRNGIVAASNDPFGVGVLGITYSVDGAAVNGSAVAGYSRSGTSPGSGRGVYGESNSFTGYGIYARNTSPSGNNDDNPKGVALYAKGATDIYYTGGASAEKVHEHVAVIENYSAADAGILALYASGIESDLLDFRTNFITFISRNSNNSGDENVGAIEGAAGGITLNTSAGDFAEWLPMSDPKEHIEAADIVGVSGGSISKNLEDADHYQVISTSPAVSGNSPKGDKRHYRRVAFIGQVPVKVRGPVQVGDYILPSGNNDGTGIARSAKAMRITDLDKVVGRAWSNSEKSGIKEINVVVGLDTTAAANQTLRQQGEHIVALEQQLARKTAQLEQQLAIKTAQLERLAARMEHFDQRLAAMAAMAPANRIAAKP